MLAQAALVFLITRLSFSVNHDLRQSDTFPGEFTLLCFTVWMIEQSEDVDLFSFKFYSNTALVKYGLNCVHFGLI